MMTARAVQNNFEAKAMPFKSSLINNELFEAIAKQKSINNDINLVMKNI